MTLQQEAARPAYGRLALLLGSVLVLAIALVWTFLGMRAVMDVGGSCASGGPYEIAQPCPDGAVLISVGVPAVVISAMLGSFLAAGLSAPTLLLPMWAVLFGSLGWNFLEYGFTEGDGLVWGWVVPGVMFELMALPALVVMVAGSRLLAITPPSVARARPSGPSPDGSPGAATWYAAYVVLGAAGAAFGWWSFDALS